VPPTTPFHGCKLRDIKGMAKVGRNAMSLYDAYGESDELLLRSFVPCMRIKTIEQARDYVAEAVRGAESIDDLDRLAAAVMGRGRDFPEERYLPADAPVSRLDDSLGRADVSGGALLYSAPDDIDDTDADTAKLMELTDAIHDFGNKQWLRPGMSDYRPETPEETEERVAENRRMQVLLKESLKANIPLEIADAASAAYPNMDPEEAQLEILADKSKFEDVVVSAQALTFPGRKPIPNPLRGRPVASITRPHAKKSTPNGSTRCVDVYFKKDGGKKIAYLIELVDLRRSMEAFFSDPYRASLGDMNVDIMIDQCMTTKFNREPSALLSWITGFRLMITALNEYFDIGKTIVGDEIQTSSTFVAWYCDATLHDGTFNAKYVVSGERLSADATGKVFHKDSEVRVKFVGPNGPYKYAFEVATTDPDVNPIPWTDYGQKSDTIKFDKGRITNKTRTAIIPKRFSAKAMADVMVDLENEDSEYRFAVPAALKRASDWGQIEHCKQKGIVFVTSDIMSALYAAYRDVKLLFVTHADRASMNTARFSFVMSGHKKTTVPMVGGYSTNVAVLALVVVACAVFGSM
jgi:hypothetical protein